MSLILELIRVLAMLLFASSLLWWLESWIYGIFIGDLRVSSVNWMAGMANLIIIFVLYRNWWQFRGWYKGMNRIKLSKTSTLILLLIAVILLIVPVFISILVNEVFVDEYYMGKILI